MFAEIIMKRQLRGTARGWHANPILFLCFFSSRRVQISGSVEDYPVPAITIDTATDVSVLSHAWLMSHPTLRSVRVQPVLPTTVALRAATVRR